MTRHSIVARAPTSASSINVQSRRGRDRRKDQQIQNTREHRSSWPSWCRLWNRCRHQSVEWAHGARGQADRARRRRTTWRKREDERGRREARVDSQSEAARVTRSGVCVCLRDPTTLDHRVPLLPAGLSTLAVDDFFLHHGLLRPRP